MTSMKIMNLYLNNYTIIISLICFEGTMLTLYLECMDNFLKETCMCMHQRWERNINFSETISAHKKGMPLYGRIAIAKIEIISLKSSWPF